MKYPRTVILTGATGFLGGHLLATLIKRGDRLIVLGRAHGEENLSSRIERLLTWFGLSGRAASVECFEVDLRKPACGLPKNKYDLLCSYRGPIVHCASDTRFSEYKRVEITEANVGGLEGVLGLAADSSASFFHYISTAYAATEREGVCPEELNGPSAHANVYEETKALAEALVAERCRRESVPFTIIRPSIVYGDSRSGRATRFNALYYPVKSLSFLRDVYTDDLKLHGGNKARACGISLADGVLSLPMRFFLPRRGRINLIPIDYFAEAVSAVMDSAVNGAVYHLTSDNPKSFDELAEYCLKYLRIKGIEIIEGPINGTRLSPPEALFARFMEPYLPYLADNRRFERASADRATASLSPPDFTYDIFERCMNYATSVGWEEGPRMNTLS
jgi:nucleoside-diphosphate-sugar epimerase